MNQLLTLYLNHLHSKLLLKIHGLHAKRILLKTKTVSVFLFRKELRVIKAKPVFQVELYPSNQFWSGIATSRRCQATRLPTVKSLKHATRLLHNFPE